MLTLGIINGDMPIDHKSPEARRFNANDLIKTRFQNQDRSKQGTWADVFFGIPLWTFFVYHGISGLINAARTGMISVGRHGAMVAHSEHPFYFFQGLLGPLIFTLGGVLFIVGTCIIRWRKWCYRHLPEPEYSQKVYASWRRSKEQSEE